jgi:hypothetical protein
MNIIIKMTKKQVKLDDSCITWERKMPQETDFVLVLFQVLLFDFLACKATKKKS